MSLWRVAFLLVVFQATVLLAGDPQAAARPREAAARVDAIVREYWKSQGITPAEPADDAEFLRRASLDLAGRIPTVDEVDAFLKDKSADKRQQLVARLIASPEFGLHMGNVLDGLIQEEYAGNAEFVDYLRRSVRSGKPWDALFKELLLGPWDSEKTKVANRFLDKRAKNLDAMTVDTARVFFGVDVSCAKCHDHPLVADWTQDHYYGMASFLNRTTGGKGKVGEKNKGEVKFLSSDGKEKTATVMFLTGTIVEEPQPVDDKQKKEKFSRREQLVKIALEEKTFFSRAIVNRMWAALFGRGLVDPVDQMHSSNEPSIPGVLEFLAEDFIENGYDLQRLVTVIAMTEAYQLSSRWPNETELPYTGDFAVARLRPLSQRQLAFSLLLATGDGEFGNADPIEKRVAGYLDVDGLARIEDYLEIEERAEELLPALDVPTRSFQTSAAEALFFSNDERIQRLVAAEGNNLTARLARIKDNDALIETAVKTVLSRPLQDDEVAELAALLEDGDAERHAACEQLVWALLGSAEFRFNH